jgi:hypothetical protein
MYNYFAPTSYVYTGIESIPFPPPQKKKLYHVLVCREGLCLPASLEMADIFIESPAAYTIRYGDRDIDSAFLKVRPFKKRPRLLFLMADMSLLQLTSAP